MNDMSYLKVSCKCVSFSYVIAISFLLMFNLKNIGLSINNVKWIISCIKEFLQVCFIFNGKFKLNLLHFQRRILVKLCFIFGDSYANPCSLVIYVAARTEHLIDAF